MVVTGVCIHVHVHVSFVCFNLVFFFQLCRTISRHHQEKEVVEHRAQKDELQRLRKIASTMAKEVKHFWDSIQKVSMLIQQYMYFIHSL